MFAVLRAHVAKKKEKKLRERKKRKVLQADSGNVCMQGCVRDGEMKRVIILLLPRGLSQPRRLPIGPLIDA